MIRQPTQIFAMSAINIDLTTHPPPYFLLTARFRWDRYSITLIRAIDALPARFYVVTQTFMDRCGPDPPPVWVQVSPQPYSKEWVTFHLLDSLFSAAKSRVIAALLVSFRTVLSDSSQHHLGLFTSIRAHYSQDLCIIPEPCRHLDISLTGEPHFLHRWLMSSRI
jgi:hypothetical protein